MRVQGSYTFDADIEKVWRSMLSSEVLAACIPGCDGIRSTGENSYEIDLTIRVASVRGAYSGEVRLEDIDDLKSYRMVVSGSGRGGSVQGSGRLNFSETDGKTVVDVVGDTQVRDRDAEASRAPEETQVDGVEGHRAADGGFHLPAYGVFAVIQKRFQPHHRDHRQNRRQRQENQEPGYLALHSAASCGLLPPRSVRLQWRSGHLMCRNI